MQIFRSIHSTYHCKNLVREEKEKVISYPKEYSTYNALYIGLV